MSSQQSLKPILLYYVKVRGLPGTYIVNQHGNIGRRPQTLITFNQGGYWSPIVAPANDSSGRPTNCHMVIDTAVVVLF